MMELLGPSLEEVFDKCGRKFSIPTVCLLALEMISRIQTVHEKNMIYRDIKPDNFLIGPRDNGTVYIVDFGMAKYYISQITGKHIPYSEKKSLSGTARYMSINTHRGREQSRRDDLEALGHVFMYFLRGNLPWQGIKANTNKEKYEKIGDRKQRVPIEELCRGFPDEFERYMKVVRGLGFEDKPNYEFLKGLFRGLLAKLGADDSSLDWRKKGISVERTVTPSSSIVERLGSPSPVPEQASGPRSPARSPLQSTQALKTHVPAPVATQYDYTPACDTSSARPVSSNQRKKQSIWKRMFCI